MKRILVSVSLLMFCLYGVRSQVEIHSLLSDTINLDEVVITGTTVSINRQSVPMSVSVVGRSGIAESNETNLLPVLNGRVPGLFVTERGVMGFGVATGAAGQISIRGIGGSPTTGVLMLIDGHPQFMGIFGHPLPDSYAASDVEKVEVIRGPASILYGSNAMGGVINIITKKQVTDGLQVNAHIMYGSYNTQKYMVSGGWKKNNLSIYASVNRDRTDGHRPNSYFSITNGYIKAAYRFNNSFNISTDLSLAGFKAQDPGPDTLNATPGSNLDILRGYWALTMNNNNGRFSGSTKIFYNFGEHNISDGFHSNDANYGLNLYQSARLFEGNTITIGADYLVYGGRAENELYGTFITDTSVYDAGVYGFMQHTFAGRLTLNAGLRLQNHSTWGSEWIPASGFAWNLTDNITWKGSASKGFRSPTIRELFVWNHNVNLDPEKVISYETGFMHSFAKRRINLELTGFIVEGTDLIVTVPMQGLQNAGEISNKGIEFAGDFHPSEKVSVNLTYSFTDMKNPVYATPRHNLYGSIACKTGRFGLSTSIQFINGLDSNPLPSIAVMENYTLLNTKLTWKLHPQAEIFIMAENILNQLYATNIYYTMPGITAFGGFKFRINAE